MIYRYIGMYMNACIRENMKKKNNFVPEHRYIGIYMNACIRENMKKKNNFVPERGGLVL